MIQPIFVDILVLRKAGDAPGHKTVVVVYVFFFVSTGIGIW